MCVTDFCPFKQDWGYKFKVSADCTKEEDAPPLPSLPSLSLLAHIKMLGARALHTQLQQCRDWLVAPSLSLFSKLVVSALSPAPASTVKEESVMEPKVSVCCWFLILTSHWV